MLTCWQEIKHWCDVSSYERWSWSSPSFLPSPVSVGGEGQITWLKDNKDADEKAEVSVIDETSSKLFIDKATLQDAGRYTCQCQFDNGHNDEAMIEVYVYGM